jgi:hypothetical protein
MAGVLAIGDHEIDVKFLDQRRQKGGHGLAANPPYNVTEE